MKVARTVWTYTKSEKIVRDGEEPEEFTATLNKSKYTVDEDITISGRVFKDGSGLKDIDITVKVLDLNEVDILTVEQDITNNNGDFVITFKLPAGTVAGEYKVTVKANTPIDKIKDLIIVIE